MFGSAINNETVRGEEGCNSVWHKADILLKIPASNADVGKF